jgi:hypothetical protein
MRPLVIAACTLLVACSSATQSTASPGTPTPGGRADLITQSEIAQHSYATALDIVQNLRPSMMRLRSVTLSQGTTAGMPSGANESAIVFVDDVRMGDLNQLGSIPANTVKEIRYINARDATTRWGTGYPAGVIQVITRK